MMRGGFRGKCGGVGVRGRKELRVGKWRHRGGVKR